jgi:hypothetical protein
MEQNDTYMRRTAVEGIGHVNVDTRWEEDEYSWITSIHVHRFDGRGRLCETIQAAWIFTDTPEATQAYWASDAVLIPYLREKTKIWPKPKYIPIPVTVNGVFQGYLDGGK